MWKLKLFVVTFCSWISMSTSVHAQEYLIKTFDIKAVSNEIEFQINDTISDAALYLIETNETKQKLQMIEEIEVIEENKTISLPPTSSQFFPLQVSEDWGFKWLRLSSLAYGTEPVRIGLLDTGVDTDHPLLLPYLEEGYTMYPNEGVEDLNGHGTGIAGIIVNQSPTSIRIVPIKVMNQYGRASTYAIIDGINQAIEAKVDIVNLSLGAINDSPLLQESIQTALEANIVIVAAAGNFGGNGALYPARYSEVIGVGALDENGEISSFSQKGEGVDVYAPGKELLTTELGGGLAYKSGTSFASGYISKAVALLKVHQSLSNNEIVKKFHQAIIIRNEIPQLSIPRLNYQALSLEEKEIQNQRQTVIINDLKKQWTIYFSKNVDPASINPRSIYIKGHHEIVESNIYVSGNTVSIQPIRPLIQGNTYSLIISNHITSSEKEPLKESVLQRFTIE